MLSIIPPGISLQILPGSLFKVPPVFCEELFHGSLQRFFQRITSDIALKKSPGMPAGILPESLLETPKDISQLILRIHHDFFSRNLCKIQPRVVPAFSLGICCKFS